MSFIELFLISVGLSMDAFAVAICLGMTMSRAGVSKAVVVGVYFGVFQAVMPLLGYMVAVLFADKIIAFDHWIAFAILCFLGVKMMAGSIRKKECPSGGCRTEMCGKNMHCDRERSNENSCLKPAQMLPLAIATSIDALAVGVSFAFLRVDIISAALFIGGVTFLMSMVGAKVGHVFGTRFKTKAELIGGVILVLIGWKILLEHLNVIG